MIISKKVFSKVLAERIKLKYVESNDTQILISDLVNNCESYLFNKFPVVIKGRSNELLMKRKIQAGFSGSKDILRGGGLSKDQGYPVKEEFYIPYAPEYRPECLYLGVERFSQSIGCAVDKEIQYCFFMAVYRC